MKDDNYDELMQQLLQTRDSLRKQSKRRVGKLVGYAEDVTEMLEAFQQRLPSTDELILLSSRITIVFLAVQANSILALSEPKSEWLQEQTDFAQKSNQLLRQLCRSNGSSKAMVLIEKSYEIDQGPPGRNVI